MKRFLHVLLLVGLAAVSAGARVGLDDGMTLVVDAANASGPDGRPFQITGNGLSVEGVVRYDREIQRLSISGTYRTRQNLGPDARLSYQLRDLAGRVLLADGERFEWRTERDWPRVASFEFRLSVIQDIPDLAALRIEFNYVEEGRYWYRDQFPAMSFPTVAILNLPMRQQFRREYSRLPVVVPAGTRCLVPVVWTVMNETPAARHYQGSVEIIDLRTNRMVDAPRLTEVPPGSAGSKVLQWQSFMLPAAGYYDLRPSFVWNEVRWYSGYVRNPFVTVLAVNPILYATGLAAFFLITGFIWIGSRRLARPGRLVMRSLLVLAILVIAEVMLTVGYAALTVVFLATWWLARRMPTLGERAYVILLGAVLLVEIYWGFLCGPQPYMPGAVVFSFSSAAILLFPLTRLRRPALVWGVTVAAVVAGLVVTTALGLYYQFFRDFPSASDLAYASQAGELGDSLEELAGSQFLVPPLLVLPLLALLHAGRPLDRAREPAQ